VLDLGSVEHARVEEADRGDVRLVAGRRQLLHAHEVEHVVADFLLAELLRRAHVVGDECLRTPEVCLLRALGVAAKVQFGDHAVTNDSHCRFSS
jgi:hypothetical protein